MGPVLFALRELGLLAANRVLLSFGDRVCRVGGCGWSMMNLFVHVMSYRSVSVLDHLSLQSQVSNWSNEMLLYVWKERQINFMQLD